MDEFSYLSVLISVILGLAVTQILKEFRGILLSRVRVGIYWPVLGWAALLLLICFNIGGRCLACDIGTIGPSNNSGSSC
jgi:hypothetical protein